MKQGTLIGPIIIAIGLVVAAISFALVGAVMDQAKGTTELRVERLESELEDMRSALDTATERVRQTEAEVQRLLGDIARQASQVSTTPAPVATPLDPSTDHVEVEDMTEVMTLNRGRFNVGITQPNNRVMLEILGRPRQNLSQDCKSITNPDIKSLLETRQVGPIRVTLIRPALESLERIMAKLQRTEPEIYEAVGTAGAICARFVRGSARAISNHSWGTAIDIKLEGKLDGFGDGGTQFGLLLVAELFNEEGWFWGATYTREDSMHFEVGVEKLREWAAAGRL
ncbi:MAG: M15 family metallopeptidase [Pseudomonadota bacterium]